jgi:hypothetical protein
MNNKQLTEIFSSVGEGYGFDDVTAKFVRFKKVKIKWNRSRTMIELRVSHYIADAPGDLVRDLATWLFLTLTAQTIPAELEQTKEKLMVYASARKAELEGSTDA